jgi:hypothetical protein
MYDQDTIADARHFAQLGATEEANGRDFAAWRKSLTPTEHAELIAEFVGTLPDLEQRFTAFLRDFYRESQA